MSERNRPPGAQRRSFRSAARQAKEAEREALEQATLDEGDALEPYDTPGGQAAYGASRPTDAPAAPAPQGASREGHAAPRAHRSLGRGAAGNGDSGAAGGPHRANGNTGPSGTAEASGTAGAPTPRPAQDARHRPARQRPPQGAKDSPPPGAERRPSAGPRRAADGHPTSRIERKKPRKRPQMTWLRTIGFILLPFVVIAAGLILYHGVHLFNIPKVDTAALEQEQSERWNFPLYYRDLIEQNADHYGLPASLIAAVVLSESSFNLNAESHKSAQGLMQIMPDTAGWIAEKLGEADTYSPEMMLVPEHNLRYGGWYLKYLADRFDGNVLNAVCAYHAGQGNVDAWLANSEYSKDGKTLDVVPTDDTSAYAKRVMNAQQVYQRRYFSAREGLPGNASAAQ